MINLHGIEPNWFSKIDVSVRLFSFTISQNLEIQTKRKGLEQEYIRDKEKNERGMERGR